ncbi:hypothetical protein GIB67_002212 [Kingdonia uniflora]|uniref:Uncharacterized protein n=1 Tax=Kingdonia uniflora TaxID=39325 RepID=A0A7J7KWR9_9MAGN|nr:hypothetical protein GIB67_002212 [Kingdonia uniflora]
MAVRRPKCEGYGSVCYDPLFVGGDGVLFYFHGANGGDFPLVSSSDLQINGHFIGTRPTGRTCNFSWVQALFMMYGEAEWRTNDGKREVLVERTDDTNSVRVTVGGLLVMDMKVTLIRAKENRVHNYQLPSDDSFVHFETQFRFFKLTDLVEGVIGVPMPMMGGEDKYHTPSLYSPLCGACRFQSVPSAISTVDGVDK